MAGKRRRRGSRGDAEGWIVQFVFSALLSIRVLHFREEFLCDAILQNPRQPRRFGGHKKARKSRATLHICVRLLGRGRCPPRPENFCAFLWLPGLASLVAAPPRRDPSRRKLALAASAFTTGIPVVVPWLAPSPCLVAARFQPDSRPAQGIPCRGRKRLPEYGRAIVATWPQSGSRGGRRDVAAGTRLASPPRARHVGRP